MNKAVETRALASKFKEALHGIGECTVEIRAPRSNTAASRLQKTLSIAGIEAQLIDVPATPHTGLLIETSQQCARIALSMQTAFRAVRIEAHLLIQDTTRPDLVIIHLNSEAPKHTAKATQE